MQELLDKNTFGGTRAAELLVEKINELDDKFLARKISKLFSQYSQGIHEIYKNIKDQHTKNVLIDLWNDHAQKRIEDSKIPEEIKSFVTNIEVTLCRKIRRGEFNHARTTNVS